jgi:hypothetical protein
MAIVLAVLALVAYRMTGALGIEERFSRAAGLPTTEGESGGGWFGFSLEGNPAAYGIILSALALLSLYAYFWRRRPER